SFLSFPPTAPPALSTLSLHDALPILPRHVVAEARPPRRGQRRQPFHLLGDAQARGLRRPHRGGRARGARSGAEPRATSSPSIPRSEEHTSELQSPYDLVCRLLLEKKK